MQTPAGAAWKVSIIYQSPFNPLTPAIPLQQLERPLVSPASCHTAASEVRAGAYLALCTCKSLQRSFTCCCCWFCTENLSLLTQDLSLHFSYLRLNWCQNHLEKKKSIFFPFPISSSDLDCLTLDHVNVWVDMIVMLADAAGARVG